MTGKSARGPRNAGCPNTPYSETFTRVELIRHENGIEHSIRFGHPAGEQILGHHRRLLHFLPGSIFAVIRQAADERGTIISRFDIVRAVADGEPYQTLPFVRPGGDILLEIKGWPRVKRVLQAIDAIEALGIDPANAAPDHWRHVHNRLTVGHEPGPYTHDHHRAWRLRRSVQP